MNTDDLPDNIVPKSPPVHEAIHRLEQFYTIELHSVRDFTTDRHDDDHMYGWMKFKWEIDEDEEFYDHFYADELSDGRRFWYTSEYVRVPKDGVPEVPEVR